MSHAGNGRRKLVLAFVIWTLQGMGGSETVVYNLARKMNKEKYRIVVISLDEGGIRKKYEELGITVRVVTASSKMGRLWQMRRALIEEEVDIVNPHHFSPLYHTFFAARFLNVKCFYTEHSRWQLEQLPSKIRMLNNFMLRNISGVIAISGQIEDYYNKKTCLREDKIYSITNGIDLTSYSPASPQMRSTLRKSLGIGQHEKVVGTVAHFRPEKNHGLLINAFSILSRRLSDVRLVLVGIDFMGGTLQQLAEERGVRDKILFLGYREDIPELMTIFDVFCLPSVFEGMPLSILEAMAAGLPVVGSDVMGINELIEDGETGLLFEQGNEEELSRLLGLALENDGLRKRLSSAARKQVEDHYSLDAKVNEYDTIFRSVFLNRS